MIVVTKVNAFLAKFVGPNAAHMIDALIAVALVAAVGFVYSPFVRDSLVHHATLALIATLAIPAATALASKFRKASGSQASLIDEIEKIVEDALSGGKTKSLPPQT